MLASSSDTNLGGINFDRNLMEYLLVKFQRTSGLDPREDKLALQRLQNAVERAKVVLSSVYRTTVVVEDMYQGKTLRETITRAEFEAINKKLFERALEHVEKALIRSGLMRSQVEEVLVVGGSVRIPKLRQLVSDFFDGRRVHPGLNSEEVVFGVVMRAAEMETINQAA